MQRQRKNKDFSKGPVYNLKLERWVVQIFYPNGKRLRKKFRREKPVNEFQFGRQTVRTKVNMMTSPEVKALPFDVADFLPWEGQDFDPFELSRAGAPDAAGAAVWDEEALSSQCSVPSNCERGDCVCREPTLSTEH